MSLTDGDFFNWYNSEITRYRDIEWKVSGYAGAFSLAIVYFATDPDRKSYIQEHPFWPSIALIIFASFLIWSEGHIHRRLNEFRAKRDSLRRGESNHADLRGQLIYRPEDDKWTDLFYFFGFESFISGTALSAIFLLGSGSFAIAGGIVFLIVFVWTLIKK